MNVNTYLSNIKSFLSSDEAVENDDIDVILHEDGKGNLIGMQFIEKGKVKFKEG